MRHKHNIHFPSEHKLRAKLTSAGEEVVNWGIVNDDTEDGDVVDDGDTRLEELRLLLVLRLLDDKLKIGWGMALVLFVFAPNLAASSLDQLNWDSDEWKSHPNPESSESTAGAVYSAVYVGGRFPNRPLPVIKPWRFHLLEKKTLFLQRLVSHRDFRYTM